MLHAASLMNATTTFVAGMLSPSKNSCRVRVPAMVTSVISAYRHDPYNWRAFSSPVKAMMMSPEKSSVQASAVQTTTATSSVPQANRLLYANIATAPAARVADVVAPTPAPTVVATAKTSVRYAYVQFKHECCTFVAPFKISTGDYVIVEGDRGEDYGQVIDITTEVPAYPVPCKVIRRATRKDQDALTPKEVKEAQAQRLTQQLAESIGLNIQVLDCVFQLDYNKLTVYFASKQHHIDFRKLQRTLFREYRCRIWLSNMAEIEAQNQLPRFR